MSEEQKKKISETMKGRIPKNIEIFKKSNKGRKITDEHRRKLSIAHKKNPSRYWLGKTRTKETIEKISINRRGKLMGDKHFAWKGGITSENHRIRNCIEYKLWRRAVFERDFYTCIWCGYKGKLIEADHIKPFAMFPELRFSIDNGRTLCKECHKKVTFKRI